MLLHPLLKCTSKLSSKSAGGGDLAWVWPKARNNQMVMLLSLFPRCVCQQPRPGQGVRDQYKQLPLSRDESLGSLKHPFPHLLTMESVKCKQQS